VSEQVQLLLLLLAAILLTATASTTIASHNIYGQAGGDTSTPSESNQKPTEEKQGGEYSGFEEIGNQTDGIPNEEANPTPQAPISGLDVQQQNKTTMTTTTTETATADERRQGPFGTTMLVGMGAVAAVAIAAGAWYYRKKNNAT
jgi:hypothetical protein